MINYPHDLRTPAARRGRAVFAALLAPLVVLTAIVVAAGDSAVADAARQGRIDQMRTLIREKADVNVPQQDGTTALHWAAEHNDLDMVVLLTGAGASANVSNQFGVTPLSLAAVNGHPDIVRALLKAGADANKARRTGETPLMTAARTGRVEVVEALLEAGANVKAKEPVAGQTAIMWAAAEGNVDVVKALIGKGADVHEASTRGFTPLLFAARNGDVELTKLLLASGVNVNEPSRDGTTALVIATVRSQIPYAKFLLENGANPNLGPGFAPLHWVVGDWSVELAGDKTHVRPEGTEYDRLLPLRGQARLDYVKLLLTHGANINARAETGPRASVGTGGPRGGGRGGAPGGAGGGGRGGRVAGATAFFMAAQLGDVALMRFLVANGADPLIRTERNVSPLMAAAGVDSNTEIGYTGVAESDALEALKYCIELGDDVHTVSTDGENALHGLGYRGNAGSNRIAQLLLDKGIAVGQENWRGWTPVTLAEGIYTNNSNSRNPDLEKLLLAHGAKPSPPGVERDAYAVIVDRPVVR